MGMIKCGICGKWTRDGVETGNRHKNGMAEYAHQKCIDRNREEMEE